MKQERMDMEGIEIYADVPETAIEAVEHLEDFYAADMWYAKENEWTDENKMQAYLDSHFKICKQQIAELPPKNLIICHKCNKPMEQYPFNIMAFGCSQCKLKASVNFEPMPIVKLVDGIGDANN